MTLDAIVVADRLARMERHLRRVKEKLPASPDDFLPATDASDAVILHLWQAVQMAIDLATALCVRRGLGAPSGYADAFLKLGRDGYLEPALADRLGRAAGFRNVVAHAYEDLDMRRVYDAASSGPADLRAFAAALARATPLQ